MYYLLCVQQYAGQPYGIEFGDKDKQVVRDELQDFKESGTYERFSNPKIVAASSMRQADCDLAVQMLNAAKGFDE